MSPEPKSRPPLELVIFVGLQATGKTTFFQQRFAATHAHVSKDNFPNNRDPSRRQMQLIEQAFESGRPVVLDNTNPRRADRAPAIAAARRIGAGVVGYYFSSKLTECLQRNAAREGKKRIEEVGLRATAKALRAPDFAEGFGALYFVRLTPAGFDVSPWRADATPPEPTHE